jgi:hypothetical protein
MDSKKLLFVLVFMIPIVLFSKENKTIESQPQILFEHEKLMSEQDKRELLLKFNTAVLYLEEEKYKHAISLLKQSSKLLKVPSYLNIGIAYYKLDSHNNAYLYLKKLYDFKELKYKDRYSYFSAAYYLYLITKDEKYINEITKVSAKAKRMTEHEKLLVVDTLILQKKYQYAYDMAKSLETISKLKVALICIKLRNYSRAKYYLDLAYIEAKGDKAKNETLWFKLYRDLKANDLTNLAEEIVKIDNRKNIFHINKKLPLELFFNKNKFTPKEYFDKITKLSYDRKLDFLYYFAPFVFEDYDVMSLEEKKGFIIRNQNSVSELNTMIQYNADFLKVIKLDPIQRVQVLQKMIDVKYDTKPYEYYNLGLAYAQIYDYLSAYKYFKKAYNLDHGNKLYSVMTFLTTKKLNIVEDKVYQEILIKNIKSNSGAYRYLGGYVYKIFEDPSTKLNKNTLTNKQKRSIFFRALYFLENVKTKGILNTEPLLVEFSKDPLVHMLNLIAKKEGENEHVYISRIQDTVPKAYNNTFLKGSLVITDFYFDTLKALGLFYKTDYTIKKEISPSYLRTLAIVNLYNDNPKKTIEIIENIQKNYDIKSVDIYYILIAALFSSGQKELAYTNLTELEIIYSDRDAKFLSGIRLLQEKKLNTAPQYFRNKLKGKFVDFRIKKFDEFLESL